MTSDYKALSEEPTALQIEEAPSKPAMTNTKKYTIIIGGSILIVTVLVAIILFALIPYIKQSTSSKSSNDVSSSTQPKNTLKTKTHKSSMPHRDDSSLTFKFASLGDWGVTDNKGHESTEKGHPFKKRDFNAQINVAKHLKSWAKSNHPSFILGQGDNFYWTGVSALDDNRWKTMFEDIYDEPALNCPWYNVMGNHDYGGGSGFCGPSCWHCGTICHNVADMEVALNNKFESQKKYKSPNGNRWQLPAHYYTRIHHHSDISIQIFNIETNAASVRLVHTCCQCYSGPTSPHGCEEPRRGHATCVHVAQYDKCASILHHWWDESMNKLKKDLAKSVATWKIVNNHYMLYHFSKKQKAQVIKILQEGGVQVFVGGHEHGEGHDLLNGIHYLLNGGGGGATAASSHGNVWKKGTYGFFVGKASKSWLQIQFFDDYGKLLHCYNIPQNRELSKLHDSKSRFNCSPSIPIEKKTSVKHDPQSFFNYEETIL